MLASFMEHNQPTLFEKKTPKTDYFFDRLSGTSPKQICSPLFFLQGSLYYQPKTIHHYKANPYELPYICCVLLDPLQKWVPFNDDGCKGNSRDSQQSDPLMVSFPYHSHIFRDSNMGVVWVPSMGPKGSHYRGSLKIPLTVFRWISRESLTSKQILTNTSGSNHHFFPERYVSFLECSYT